MLWRPRKGTAKRLRLADQAILLGIIVTVFGLGLHAIQLYREIQRLNWLAESRIMVDTSPFFPRLHALFVLAFLLSLLGLLLRSRTGLVLSTLSLILGLLVYGYWYNFSYRDLRLIRESEYPVPPDAMPPHVFGLIDASWLDIAILFAVIVVVAWQIKFLISTFRRTN